MRPSPSPNLSVDSFRQYLLGQNLSFTSLSDPNGTQNEQLEGQFCQCLSQLESLFCVDDGIMALADKMVDHHPISPMDFHSDVGRMLYTIAILLMFSFVIFALMVRSISRSRSSAELETLLEAMRFREELDIQLRQKHRLRKAKRKVTAWLCRTNGSKLWQSSPHILLPNIGAIRNDSLQSSGSYIPEIVISTENNNTNDLGGMFIRSMERQNSYTPSLSLIYDFTYDSRKGSEALSSTEYEYNERVQQSASDERGSGDESGEARTETKLRRSHEKTGNPKPNDGR